VATVPWLSIWSTPDRWPIILTQAFLILLSTSSHILGWCSKIKDGIFHILLNSPVTIILHLSQLRMRCKKLRSNNQYQVCFSKTQLNFCDLNLLLRLYTECM
jgi:hypothetical protein